MDMFMINMSICTKLTLIDFQNHPESRPKLYNNDPI